MKHSDILVRLAARMQHEYELSSARLAKMDKKNLEKMNQEKEKTKNIIYGLYCAGEALHGEHEETWALSELRWRLIKSIEEYWW